MSDTAAPNEAPTVAPYRHPDSGKKPRAHATAKRLWPLLVAVLVAGFVGLWLSRRRHPLPVPDAPPELLEAGRMFPLALPDLPPSAPLEPLLASDHPAQLAILEPDEGATRVDRGVALTVRFNRPMVPGTSVGHDLAESPLRFDPPVPGATRWITRSELQFTADAHTWDRTVESRWTLSPALRSLAGETLEDDTTRIAVFPGWPLLSSPSRETVVATGAPIPLEFDRPVDPSQAARWLLVFEENGGRRDVPFSLVPGGVTASGRSRVNLVLGRAFEPGVRIGVAASPLISSWGGAAPNTYSYQFAPRARITGIACPPAAASGDACEYQEAPSRVVDIGETLRVIASEPLAPLDPRSITVRPQPVGLTASLSNATISVRADWVPGQVYELRFGALRDRRGGEIVHPSPLAVRSAGQTPRVEVRPEAARLAFEPDAPATLRFRGVHLDNASVEYQPVAPGEELRASLTPSDTTLIPPDAAWIPTALGPLAPRARPNRWGAGEYPWIDASHGRDGAMALVRFVPDMTAAVDPPAPMFVQRTDLGITARALREGLLVWATSIATAEPVADVQLTVGRALGAPMASGRTQRDGTAWIPWRVGREFERVAIRATHGSDRAVLVLDPRIAQGPGAFGLASSVENMAPPAVLPSATVFTDHGVYRPGETVRAKIVVRTGPAWAMRALTSSRVQVQLISPASPEPVATASAPLGEFGTADVQFDLDPHAPQGSYTLNVQAGTPPVSLASGSMRVVEYRQPTMRADLDVPAAVIEQGDPIVAHLVARYLFGAAVAAGQVDWTLYRGPEWDFPAAWAAYRFTRVDPPSPTATVDTGSVTLDENGAVELHTTAAVASTVRERQTLEVTVADDAGHEIAARRDFVVFPASFEIGVHTGPEFQDPGSTLDLAAVVIGHDGAAVQGRTITARVLREAWHSHWEMTHAADRETGDEGDEPPAGGTYQARRAQERTVERTCTLTSSGEPVHCTLQPTRPGSYVLEASATDDAGRTVTASRRVYLTGPGEHPDRDAPSPTFAVTPTRTRWNVGERARVAFECPWREARALLSVEHAGTVLREVRAVAAGGNVFEFDVTAEMVPNVAVSVVLVKRRTAAPDGPIDTGAPEVRMGAAPIEVRPAPTPLAVTVTPSTPSAEPGQEVTFDVSVLDPRGRGARAEVTLFAVDEGVLRLSSYTTPDPVPELFRSRTIDFYVDDLRRSLVSRARVTDEALPGGDGGDDSGGGSLGRDDTDRIDPTALWLPRLVTDARGHAHGTMRVPNRSTTYRIMAVAIGEGLQAGHGIARVVATRPVVIRPALPAAVTDGDHVEAAAFVHNTTNAPVDVQATITAGGALLLTRALRLEPGHDERISVGVDARGEALPIVIEATSAAGHDRYTATLAVAPRGHSMRAQSVGMVRTHREVAIAMPPGALVRDGLVELTVATHPFVGFRAAADGIDASVRYGEEAADAVLALAGYQLLGAGARDAHDEADLRVRGILAIERLAGYQTATGGYSAWFTGDSDPGLSARALLALTLARRVGWPVPAGMIERAQRDLATNYPDTPGTEVDDGTALRAHALSESGRVEPARIDAVYSARARLGAEGLAHLALALPAGDGRRSGVVLGALTAARARLRVPRRGGPLRGMPGSAPELAAVLEATSRADVGWEAAPVLASALLALRTEGAASWGSVSDTSAALAGLAAYAARYHETALGDVTVTLDGAALAPVRRTRDAARYVLPFARVMEGSHALTIHAQGTAYFALDARWYAALGASDEVARGRDVAVHRVYENQLGAPLAPGAHVRVGDRIRVRLFVYSDRDAPGDLLLRDRVPGGFEALDADLDTTPRESLDGLLGRGVDDDTASDPRAFHALGALDRIAHRVFARGETRFHLTGVTANLSEFTYGIRATTPGTYAVAPAELEGLTSPAFHGRSTMATFTVDAQ